MCDNYNEEDVNGGNNTNLDTQEEPPIRVNDLEYTQLLLPLGSDI